MSRVGVVGAGYVGATTSACLAYLGHEVACGDRNTELVKRLNDAAPPIMEERLPELIRDGLASERLRFVEGAAAAARGAEFLFLCVDTPQDASGAADLSRAEAAVREAAPELGPGAIVVIKSTMPVGSARRVAAWLEEEGSAARVATNPEFLQEGTAVREFLNPERIVLGCDDEETAVRLSLLYRKLQARIIVTDPASAEMIKYASNAYLATRISFINSIANLSEAVGADVRDVALGMGYDSRIGFAALNAGPGFGGSCLPKDTSALLHTAREFGFEFEQLASTITVNLGQRTRVAEKVRRAAGGVLEGVRVGVWGLTFKANTDDVRESPAVDVVRQLVDAGARVAAYDPGARIEQVGEILDVELADDPYSAVEDAQVLAVLTEWEKFRWLDFERVYAAMANPAVVDARNLLDREALVARGFVYDGVGR